MLIFSAAPKGGGCGGKTRQDLRALLSAVLARQFRHGRVQRAIARHYLPALEVKLVSPVIRDFATRFLEDQASGRYVPRPDAALVVTVQPTCGDVAEVERGGAKAPHPSGDGREAPEELEGLRHLWTPVFRRRGKLREGPP